MTYAVVRCCLVFLFLSSPAYAGLIGQTVHLGHNLPDLETEGVDILVDGSGSPAFTPRQGPSEAPLYAASVFDEGLSIDFAPEYDGSGFEPVTDFYDLSFNGLVLSAFEGVLSNFIVDTNLDGWNEARLIYSGGSLGFNFAGLSADAHTYVNLSFDMNGDNSAAVPEPSTVALLLGGLLLLAWRRIGEKAPN